MFCWIQLSIITFPFSFDDIMTSNSWSLKSTNYCLVQLPWDLNFGLNIVHSWVTCFACSMKQNLGQISQQAADVIISGWGGTFWVDIPVFYGQKSIHFCWWSPHFCWNPSFSCGFFPRWKVKVPHLSLVKSWEIHHKKLAVFLEPHGVFPSRPRYLGIGHGQRSPLRTGNPRWPPSSHRPAAPERRRSWNTWWTQRMAPGHQWWDGLNATERYWALYPKILYAYNILYILHGMGFLGQ